MTRRATHALSGCGVALFLLAVALAWCAPALRHGLIFGSFDVSLHSGIGRSLATTVANTVGADQARQDAVWMNLNWTAVHAGHLPLWNPFSELGLPELANAQSAPFSLASLVAYAFPLRLAYGISVLVKLLISGSGCYFCARVLGTSRPAALLAGVVGELAGPNAAWAGWPQAGVAAWTGWLLAMVVLCARAPRTRHAAGLALVVAGALAGGFPEVAGLLGATGLVVAIGAVAARSVTGSPGSHVPATRAVAIGRSVVTLLGGSLGGAALAAPAWLVLWPVFRVSASALRVPQPSVPAGTLPLFLDPTWFGLPTGTGNWFGPSNYYETAAFVGPAVLCCAVAALVRRGRRPEVAAIGVAVTLLACLAYGVPGLHQVVDALPLVRTINFGRGLLLADDGLAILAAVGLDALVRDRPVRADRWVLLGAGWAITAIASGVAFSDYRLSASARSLRLDGLWAAVAGIGALSVLFAAVSIRARREDRDARRATPSGAVGARRWSRALVGTATVVLVVAQSASLVTASASVNTWARRYLPENAPIRTLLRTAGTRLVALGGGHGPSQAPHLGLFPELNAAYGLRELAGYDAMTPKLLEAAWIPFSPVPDLAAHELNGDVTSFSPAVSSVAAARAFGVSFVLEPDRAPRRLADDARAIVARALARDGVRSPQVVTGVLDDLEWLIEQPLVSKRFPGTRPRYLLGYLSSVAAGGRGLPEPPTPLARPAARVMSRLASSDPSIEGSLEATLTAAPLTGFVVAARLGDEVLYAVARRAGARRGAGAGPVTSDLVYLGDASAHVTTSASRPSWATLAVSDEPGWSASSAGRVLQVRRDRASGQLQVRVPAGRHRLTLEYWPEGLSEGLGLAAAALGLGLVGAAASSASRRRRRRISAHAATDVA